MFSNCDLYKGENAGGRELRQSGVHNKCEVALGNTRWKESFILIVWKELKCTKERRNILEIESKGVCNMKTGDEFIEIR